jgi:hypothetical protein
MRNPVLADVRKSTVLRVQPHAHHHRYRRCPDAQSHAPEWPDHKESSSRNRPAPVHSNPFSLIVDGCEGREVTTLDRSDSRKGPQGAQTALAALPSFGAPPIVGLRTRLGTENIETEKPASGGRCQWVLDAASETVEWLGQPLRFESVVLRTVSRLWFGIMGVFERQRTDWHFAEPRLTSGASDFYF